MMLMQSKGAPCAAGITGDDVAFAGGSIVGGCCMAVAIGSTGVAVGRGGVTVGSRAAVSAGDGNASGVEVGVVGVGGASAGGT
jgi:hypothetical protein